MPAASSLKVLVADDQLAMRALIRSGLQHLGFSNIQQAADGREALELLGAGPVHLILSNVNMPNLDGLGLLEAVRTHATLKSTAFIMLTGRADRELVQRAAALGVNNYIVKPFATDKLKEKIEAVFGRLT